MLISTTDSALLRLLQLASPALPVGAYAFSQGMEYAIDAGWLKNSASIKDWLSLQLDHSLAGVDLVLLQQCMEAWQVQDLAAVRYCNATLLACRETAELRMAELAMGEALARLLPAFGMEIPETLHKPGFVVLFARAATHWHLEPRLALYAYAWSWLENQVMAATKLLPLGQTQAQLLLHELQQELPPLVERALQDTDREPGAGLPGATLASCLHETQYSRLFRS